MQNNYLSSVSNNGIRAPFSDVVIKSLLQTLAIICPFITEKRQITYRVVVFIGVLYKSVIGNIQNDLV